MKLPCTRVELETQGQVEVLAAIRERRAVIRAHRDKKGHERCWLNDYAVWAMVEGLAPFPTCPPFLGAAMTSCGMFSQYRRSDTAPIIPEDAITDPTHWDDDLVQATFQELVEKLVNLQEAIHVWSLRLGSTQDDDWLYGHLPEKLPADHRLPPEAEFLGLDGPPRNPGEGCRWFWLSHKDCGPAGCDLTRLGPCGNPEVQ